MKYLSFSLAAPAGLLIVFYSFALLFGTDPWLMVKTTVLCLPSAAYVAISHGLCS